MTPLDVSLLGARIDVYRHGEPLDLRGPIFLAALTLLMIDALVVVMLSGGLSALRPRRRAAAVLAAATVFGAVAFQDGHAQSTQQQQLAPLTAQQEDFAMKATLQTHLAYVVTGDASVDEVSKSGLQGLTLFLAQRTALEAGDPSDSTPRAMNLRSFR